MATKHQRGRTLQEKVIVITGASSGAGRAMAIELAKHGARLVLAARREKVLQEVAAECEELGATALVLPTDMADSDAVQLLAGAANEWGGKIDVWINNAGVLAAGNFEETPIDVHDQVVKVNLMGYMHGAHAVLPYFKQQGYGTLINNISVGGWVPTPYGVGYTASKFGLRGFSEALRGELHNWKNIHVCDLFPAFLDTPGIQHAGNYTGRLLKPAPPVYDPMKVARVVHKPILDPKKSVMVGAVTPFLKISHALFPSLTRWITADVIEAYLNQAEKVHATDGNLFESVPYGTSIHGGWQKPATEKQKFLSKVVLAAGMVIGFMILARRD